MLNTNKNQEVLAHYKLEKMGQKTLKGHIPKGRTKSKKRDFYI